MKNKKDKTKEDVLVSSVIEKEKKCNGKPIVILLIVIVILLIVLLYMFFNKNSCDELQCSSVTIKEVEVDPKYQLINYNGFRFKMPLEWDFINSDNNKYEITDKDEKLYIFLNTIDVNYEMFDTGEYQKDFLESIQTSGDIKIDNVKEKEENGNKYYLYEGKYNDYDYLIVVIGNNEKTILINAKFIDKISYNGLKEEVISFALTAI